MLVVCVGLYLIMFFIFWDFIVMVNLYGVFLFWFFVDLNVLSIFFVKWILGFFLVNIDLFEGDKWVYIVKIFFKVDISSLMVEYKRFYI